MLDGGRNTSTREALGAVAEVLANPALFPALFQELNNPEILIKTRAAYAVSKISDQRPELLQPFKDEFLDHLGDPDNNAITRACLLQTVHHLELAPNDLATLVDWLQDFMHADSSIVKTFSLQLLVDFAAADESLRPTVMPVLWDALERGTPAMRARARKLIKKYGL